jgi:DNA-binding response OmpR family regulator
VFLDDNISYRIWGSDGSGDAATVPVHVNRLREKLEKDPAHPQYIETVWGAGYRFKA